MSMSKRACPEVSVHRRRSPLHGRQVPCAGMHTQMHMHSAMESTSAGTQRSCTKLQNHNKCIFVAEALKVHIRSRGHHFFDSSSSLRASMGFISRQSTRSTCTGTHARTKYTHGHGRADSPQSRLPACAYKAVHRTSWCIATEASITSGSTVSHSRVEFWRDWRVQERWGQMTDVQLEAPLVLSPPPPSLPPPPPLRPAGWAMHCWLQRSTAADQAQSTVLAGGRKWYFNVRRTS